MLLLTMPSLTIASDIGGVDDFIPLNGVTGEVTTFRILGENDLPTAASTYNWTGNGSEDNPYIIENMVINASGNPYGLHIGGIYKSHILIRNNRFHNVTISSNNQGAYGNLGLDRCINVTIQNNTFENSVDRGFMATDSNVKVLNNSFRGNTIGLRTVGSDHNATIEGNTFLGPGDGIMVQSRYSITNNTLVGTGERYSSGIRVWPSGTNLISNNTVSNYDYGINLLTGGVDCFDNTIRNSTFSGIYGGVGATISGNVIEDASQGITLLDKNNILRNNTLSGCAIDLEYFAGHEPALRSTTIDATNKVDGRPVRFQKDVSDVTLRPTLYGQEILVGCSNVKLENETLSNSYWLDMFFSENISITGNQITMGNKPQWRFVSVEDGSIFDNNLSGLSWDLRYVDRLTLNNNSIINVSIEYLGGSNNQFDNNTIEVANEDALQIRYESSFRCMDNDLNIRAPRADQYAVRILNVNDFIMRDNSMWGAGISNPWGESDDYWADLEIDISNTVNGRPLLYLNDVSDEWVTGEYGQVIISYSTDVRIDNLRMGKYDGGIHLLRTHNTIIDHCSFVDSINVAVTLNSCNNLTVSNNLFDGGNSALIIRDCAIAAPGLHGTVSGNYFMNVTPFDSRDGVLFIYGSILDSVTSNMFFEIDGYGIYSSSVNINEMSNNEFVNCSNQAIFNRATCEDGIHHNSFIDNAIDETGAQCWDRNLYNLWDNGTEGNYWSNYLLRYPNATNDGTVWDTPYLVGERYRPDRYPIVDYDDRIAPWAWIEHNETIYPDEPTIFNARVLDNQGVVGYNWTFLVNDTTTHMSDRAVDYTFPLSGDFSVGLKVWDAAGNVAETIKIVHVADNIPPVARAGEDLTVIPGTTVTFDGSASSDDKGVVAFVWSFEYDGGLVELKGEMVQFTFTLMGAYNVTLTVHDLAGNTHQDVLTVVVDDKEPPTAVIGPDRTVPQRATLQFSGKGSTDNWRIISYNWTVTSPGGALTYYDTPDISHMFEEPGVHTVTLRVTDPAGLWDETSISVTAEDITVPVAVSRDDIGLGQNEHLTLDGTGSTDNEAVVNWTWTISGPGDDRVLYGPTHEVSFTDAGYYTVVLTVFDDWGNNGSTSFTVTVVDTEPPVAVAGDDIVTDQGKNVDLDGSASSDNVDIGLYLWTFTHDGKEVEKTGPFVTFTFENPGEYIITLSVSDLMGNVGTDTVLVTVRDTTPPFADAGDDITVDQHTTVTFDGSASYDNAEMRFPRWTFVYDSEEQEMMGLAPEFTFDLVGEYVVTLTVQDDAGRSPCWTSRPPWPTRARTSSSSRAIPQHSMPRPQRTMWASSRGGGPSPRVASKGRWRARMPSSYSRSTVSTS